VSFGPSLHSIKQVWKDDLGISLELGGRTLWHLKDSGNDAKTFLLAKTSTGYRQVY
jgi:hypothetical protein